MIWKIMHRLFGYDYVAWNNTADHGVARICVDAEGNPFYWRYKGLAIVDKLDNPYIARNAVWLTCARGKYLKND